MMPPATQITLWQLAAAGTRRLLRAGLASADQDCAALLLEVSGQCTTDWANTPATPAQIARFLEFIDRRAHCEPVAYLTGSTMFRGLRIRVGPGVYVPQPETETLIELAKTELRSGATPASPLVGIDLCTGSAVVALMLAVELGNVRIAAVEKDERAAQWARLNITHHAERSAAAGSSVELFVTDARNAPGTVLAPVRALCDFVVSNPPYVDGDGATRPEIRDHAPAVAISGGQDGLDVIRDVIGAASELLRPGALLLIEHEADQGQEGSAFGVPGLLRTSGNFTDIIDHKDHEGRPRVTSARRRAH